MTAQTASWFVGSVRATVFADPASIPSAKDAWTAVFSADPSASTIHKSGVEVARGGRADRWLDQITKTIGRIDFQRDAILPAATRIGNLKKLSPCSEVIKDAAGIALKLAQAVPAAKRVALAGVLKQPAASQADSYRFVRPYIPEVSLQEDWSDLIYRVNRPAKHRGLTINRLAKWEIGTEQPVEFTPDGLRLGAPEWLVTLEVDVNTDAARSMPFSSSELPEIIEYLCRQYVAITQGNQS